MQADGTRSNVFKALGHGSVEAAYEPLKIIIKREKKNRNRKLAALQQAPMASALGEGSAENSVSAVAQRPGLPYAHASLQVTSSLVLLVSAHFHLCYPCAGRSVSSAASAMSSSYAPSAAAAAAAAAASAAAISCWAGTDQEAKNGVHPVSHCRCGSSNGA